MSICAIQSKDSEWKARGEGTGIQYITTARGHKVLQWRNILNDINKNNLIEFIVDEWKLEGNWKLLGGNILYVTSQANCWKITQDGFEEVEELMCTHKEADTESSYSCSPCSQVPIWRRKCLCSLCLFCITNTSAFIAKVSNKEQSYICGYINSALCTGTPGF